MPDAEKEVYEMLKLAGAERVRRGKHDVWRIPGSKQTHVLSKTTNNPRAWLNARARIRQDLSHMGIELDARGRKLKESFSPRVIEHADADNETVKEVDLSEGLPRDESPVLFAVQSEGDFEKSQQPKPPTPQAATEPLPPSPQKEHNVMPHGPTQPTASSILQRAAIFKHPVRRVHKEPPAPVFKYAQDDISHADFLRKTQGEAAATKFLAERKTQSVTTHAQTSHAHPTVTDSIRDTLRKTQQEIERLKRVEGGLMAALEAMGQPTASQTPEPPQQPRSHHEKKPRKFKGNRVSRDIVVNEAVNALQSEGKPLQGNDLWRLIRTNPLLSDKSATSFNNALLREEADPNGKIERQSFGIWRLRTRS